MDSMGISKVVVLPLSTLTVVAVDETRDIYPLNLPVSAESAAGDPALRQYTEMAAGRKKHWLFLRSPVSNTIFKVEAPEELAMDVLRSSR